MQYEPLIEEVWSDDSEKEGPDMRIQPAQRQRTNSNNGIIDQRIAAVASCPMPSTVSVRNSRHVRFGPTIVSVTHNDNVETVKARFLCLDLETEKQAKKLRCSVAICSCWTLAVSLALAVYIFFLVRMVHETRYDINHPWYVPRSDWLAQETENTVFNSKYLPIRLVIVQNSITKECYRYRDCGAAMKALQYTYLTDHNQDIPYNFLIGNDGRVYEGRGWGLQPVPSTQYYPCAIVVGFIGDYREELSMHTRVTEQQINNTLKLLEFGVQKNYLHTDYVVQGAKDLVDSQSPGSNLHAAIKKWKHYDPEHRYKELTCDEIHFLKNITDLDVAPHEWEISRDMWKAKPYNNTIFTTNYEPLRLVLIHNTISRECHSFVICSIELRKLQMWFALMEEDVPYNFIIANDGRVYESRGWGVDGGQSKQFGRCSISIGFLGEYTENSEYNSKVSDAQLNRTLMLLDEGVRLKHLDPEYVILGAKDVYATTSPGDNLYNAIQKLQHYSNGIRFKNKTCEEIGAGTSISIPSASIGTIPSATLTSATVTSSTVVSPPSYPPNQTTSTTDLTTAPNVTVSVAVDSTTPSSIFNSIIDCSSSSTENQTCNLTSFTSTQITLPLF